MTKEQMRSNPQRSLNMQHKSIGSYVALVVAVLCVMLTASVVAQTNWYPTKYVSADSGVFRWVTVNKGLVAKGGIGMRVTYTGAIIGSAVIPQWSLVGWDSTPIVVVTRALIGDTLDQRMTVADSLHSTVLDTLPRYGASVTQYDTSKIASFYLRIRVTAADGTNDTVGVIVRGKDQNGISQRITFKFKQTGTLDTTLLQLFSHVDSLWATGKAAGDSVAVWAYTNGPAVVTGTGYATATGPESYAGVAQTALTTRTRGIVNWEGPSKVLIDGTASSVRPSYWILPATVAGKCSTSRAKPDLTIGKVWDRGNIDGTYNAWLHIDAGSAGGLGADSTARAAAAAAQASADTALDWLDTLTTGGTDTAFVDSVAQFYAPTILKASFRAGQFIVPQTGGPALLQSDSTNTSWFSLAYDGTTAEKAYIFDVMQGYALSSYADSLGVRVYWTADTAGLDTVRWTVDFNRRGDGQLLDSTLNLGGFMLDVNHGRGKLNVCAANFTLTGASANDLIDMAIGRNPAAGDNMTRDAEMVLCVVTLYPHTAGGGN
jgi:hypothetical protein